MRLLIVEDEPLVAMRLERLIQAWAGPRLRLKRVATLDDAEELLQQRGVDALLLDLNLQGEDGFDLLRRTLARGLQTIVVSAHTERAIEAFELGVLDFVPKPFTPERLHAALERLLDAGSRVLSVWRAQGVAVVPVDQIRSIRAAGDSCELLLRNGRTELLDRSLDALQRQLPTQFQRCHRSSIVNLLCVRQLRGGRGSRYTLILDDGSELPVGRTHLADLRNRLGLGD